MTRQPRRPVRREPSGRRGPAAERPRPEAATPSRVHPTAPRHASPAAPPRSPPMPPAPPHGVRPRRPRRGVHHQLDRRQAPLASIVEAIADTDQSISIAVGIPAGAPLTGAERLNDTPRSTRNEVSTYGASRRRLSRAPPAPLLPPPASGPRRANLACDLSDTDLDPVDTSPDPSELDPNPSDIGSDLICDLRPYPASAGAAATWASIRCSRSVREHTEGATTTMRAPVSSFCSSAAHG